MGFGKTKRVAEIPRELEALGDARRSVAFLELSARVIAGKRF